MTVSRFSLAIGIATALALAGVGTVVAQGKSGSAVPIDASGAFEVSGISVDVRGKDAESARMGGWRIGQRKGWEMLSQKLTGRATTLSDSTLDSIVTSVIVEHEQLGPNRYIAKLGMLFDRQKAASILGVSTTITRSPPMLLVPLEHSAGAGVVFERETEWASAWSRFRAGGSTIDYVRVRGTGANALLINSGQTLRRGRNWWRSVLNQYGAADVLVAEVALRREYPGGPIVGNFTASHGPDKVKLTSFALRVDSSGSMDMLMDAGVARIDQAYQAALAGGQLYVDRMLATRIPQPEAIATEPSPTASSSAASTAPSEAASSITVQVDTPNVNAFNASEGALRAVPGVRGSNTVSTALGGISIMRVTYDGSISGLRAALEARGWQVQEGAGVLRIRRAQAAPPPQSANPAAPATPE